MSQARNAELRSFRKTTNPTEDRKMDTKPIESCFGTLGLEPGATFAEVKEAYRFLVQTFHEDKYPAHSPYKEKAHLKMVELNDAYEKLKKFFQDNPSGQ